MITKLEIKKQFRNTGDGGVEISQTGDIVHIFIYGHFKTLSKLDFQKFTDETNEALKEVEGEYLKANSLE